MVRGLEDTLVDLILGISGTLVLSVLDFTGNKK
jgi:hypothetical protein